MSQSDAHRKLVVHVARVLELRYPLIPLITDLPPMPGDEIPPLIGGYRPDLHARKTSTNPVVIGEAKTDCDLDKKHTYNQIISFITYLERQGDGFFVLSVTGSGANRAKTVLRFTHHHIDVTNTEITVFDGCDLWFLDSTGGLVWRLG